MKRPLSNLARLLALATLSALPVGPLRAQAPDLAQHQPDVLVLIFAVPGGPAQIDLTYPGVVPHAQARRDVHAIQTATGWDITGIHVTDQLPPVLKSTKKMTGVDFVAPGALPAQEQSLPVGPFVEALRSYHRVFVTYVMDRGFAFQGLRQYADNHVSIVLDQRGSTYTYQITIRDGHFGHLDLPRYQLSNTDTRSAHRGKDAHRAVNPGLVALVALAAVGAGCVVYAFLTRNV